jgi:hypothetical protein
MTNYVYCCLAIHRIDVARIFSLNIFLFYLYQIIKYLIKIKKKLKQKFKSIVQHNNTKYDLFIETHSFEKF